MSHKMYKGFALLSIFTVVFLFPVVFSQSNVIAHVNQEKACEEYKKCMAIRENSKGTIKTVDVGPNVLKIVLDKSICAYKSNCRKERRAICKTHMGPNGSDEMKVACLVSWSSGSDETDDTDPATANNIESNQTIACANYDKCFETADEELTTIQKMLPIHDAVPYAKETVCAERTNCVRAQLNVCEKMSREKNHNHKFGSFASLLCAISWYTHEDDKNSIGSRSLGSVSKSQQVLAEVCQSSKNGYCVIS